jgi:hypothetical protein
MGESGARVTRKSQDGNVTITDITDNGRGMAMSGGGLSSHGTIRAVIERSSPLSAERLPEPR